jgi:bifunctional aspartokinase / homoserine dehydrogenase 1
MVLKISKRITDSKSTPHRQGVFFIKLISRRNKQMALHQNPTNKRQSPILVMKFGGTSIGTPQAMEQTAEIISKNMSRWPRAVIVISALSMVTDLLLHTAYKAIQGDLESTSHSENRLRELHLIIAEHLLGHDIARCRQVMQDIDLLIASFSNLCKAVAVLGEATPRALDAIAAHGERMSVRLLAPVLEVRGVSAQVVEATQLIVTDDHFQAAHPILDATKQKTRQILGPLLEKGFVPVVTGFIGATEMGITTTLGRGGSDYSAALMGAALEADDVWIWTDVDGVLSADPHIIPEARTIEVLNYREIAELAYFGAKVLHPKAIRPVIEAGIGLRICNTFNPGNPGTRLIPNGKPEYGANRQAIGCLKAVTAIREQCFVTVEGRGMLGVPGVAARTFSAVASTGASVTLITQASSEQSICFAVSCEAVPEVLKALNEAFAREIAVRDIDCIRLTGDVSIITVVGAGMNSTPGIAGQIFNALGKRKVNVIAIAQGSSEVATSLVVEQADAYEAVSAIHELILSGLPQP